MKGFRLISFTIAFLFLCMSLYAQELKGMIYVSNQTEDYDPAKIVREYIIGETAYCAFLVQGFAINPPDSVDLTADIKFIDPQRNITFEQQNYAKAKTRLSQDQQVILLDSSFDITFDDENPIGMYTVEAIIKDNIIKAQDTVQVTILLFDTAESKSLIMAPVSSAKQLDDLWAEYFRSKNPWAVKRIISALRLRKESPNLDDAIIGSAAKWSLEANAKQYPEVLSICEQSLKNTTGAIKELLEEIINKVKKDKQ